MRRLYLCDCTPGDVLEDVYVITNKQLSATTTGKYFIKAFISDRTGQITSRMWNANREIFNALPESGFIRLRGRVENYQNNLQFIIEQIWPAKDGSFDVADLMPHTSRDIDQMCQRLFEMCGTIRNRHLKAIVQAYLDDENLMNDFCRAPAAMNFHHAFIGGLLEHTLNAMEVSDAVCKFYPALNRDLVVAGIFLHDIAKTWELKYDCAFGYTDGGQLVGHVVKAAMWVEEKAQQASAALGEEIPRPLIDVLQHIVLSHHGLPEFGAARTPSTPEAIAVHVIENLDAKLMMALSTTRGAAMPGSEGNWTEYLKAFNGRLYRPDVAPPDGGSAGEAEKPQDGQESGEGQKSQDGEKQQDGQKSQAGNQRETQGAPGKVAITNPLFETSSPRKK
ncbi:MAG TPA: HD domain-containing protein [Tepidisphaeraceae bacterium]|nr:HD domain-containing protein [Tepidisphaeraceae bacterium]